MADLAERWVSAMRDENYAAAWAACDEAMRARDPAARDDPARPCHERWVWDGRPFDGCDVLVRCYHGLGDTIQFARFLPLLARRAASVMVEAQAHLLPLLASAFPQVRFVPFDPARPRPPTACDLEITELPHALRATPADAALPYLHAKPTEQPATTIGLCYAAGPWDPARNLPPALMSGLCGRRPCVTLVAEPTTLPVANLEGCPLDIRATAALVAACDLVITVDTMIAHLAGALGRPTWLLLRAKPDWRWRPDRRDSPWYPTMRLYAQARPGDWCEVIARVAADLADHDLTRKGDTADGAHPLPHRPDLLG